MRKNKAAAEIWFKKAKDHLAFARAGWKESRIVSDTCVLCQQAVEKAFKSLLELENINVGKTPALKTHRLADIIEECKKYYQGFNYGKKSGLNSGILLDFEAGIIYR